MTDGRTPAVAIVRVPLRLGSISGGRFDLAPAAIHDAAHDYVARSPRGPGVLTGLGSTVEDHGDADVAAMRPGEAFDRIRRHVAVALEDEAGRIRADRALVLLGGDNSITRPGVHGIAIHPGLERTGLLTIDAHHDLRDTGGGLTNGNPVRALLEDGLPGSNIVQVGIQAFANMPEHAELAREVGITVVTAADVRARGVEAVVTRALSDLDRRVDAIYVDLDVDVLDRAFAPACPGSRPGGLTPADVQRAAYLAGRHPKVRAMDVVEVDPERDVAGITVMGAASFVLAFASGVADRRR